MRKSLFFLIFGFALIAVSCGEKVYRASIETEMGEIVIELSNETPLHRDNFIKLVKQGYYDGLLFHRVIQDFMIQGGDPDSRNAPSGQRLGAGGPNYTIPAEIGQLHYRGTLAAARLGGSSNPQKASSGSQFYIVHGKKSLTETDLARASQFHKYNYTPEEKSMYLETGGYPSLDNNYTVFGRVVKGMEVVDQIATVSTAPDNRPMKDITMNIRMVR